MASSITLIIVTGFIGGVAVAVQASLAGIISERLGLLENAVVVFGTGALAALALLFLTGGGKLRELPAVPWYVFLAGPMGIIIISSLGLVIPRIGVGATLALVVTSQLITGVILDHFGWLTAPHALDLKRLAGMGLLMLGTWIVLR